MLWQHLSLFAYLVLAHVQCSLGQVSCYLWYLLPLVGILRVPLMSTQNARNVTPVVRTLPHGTLSYVKYVRSGGKINGTGFGVGILIRAGLMPRRSPPRVVLSPVAVPPAYWMALIAKSASNVGSSKSASIRSPASKLTISLKVARSIDSLPMRLLAPLPDLASLSLQLAGLSQFHLWNLISIVDLKAVWVVLPGPYSHCLTRWSPGSTP